MSQEESSCCYNNIGKPTTIINVLVFIRACGAIEPCIVVAPFNTMFHTTVSYMDSSFQTKIFLQNMESIRISSSKDIWKIRKGGQGTNRVFRGNRDGRWEQIWVISGSLTQGGQSSMVMVGNCITGMPQSSVKGLSNQS